MGDGGWWYFFLQGGPQTLSSFGVEVSDLDHRTDPSVIYYSTYEIYA